MRLPAASIKYSEHRVKVLSRLFAVLVFAWHLSIATTTIVRAFTP